MKKQFILFSIILFVVVLSAFMDRLNEEQPVTIPPSKQRLGNAQKGYDYLVTGDYVKSGVPFDIFMLKAKADKNNYLSRDGLNKKLPFDYNAVKAGNGKTVVVPNCLQCHAQVFDGQLVMGLGNSAIDFTEPKVNPDDVQKLERFLKTAFPKQYEASEAFLTVTKSIAPYLIADVRGVNMASRLTTVLAAHRDPVTLKWKDEPQLPIPNEVIPSDTPPWWLLKKKNAMFYNGFGRGDFGRFLMASNLLTVSDSSESEKVDAHMPDVLSFIYSLKPPKFPKEKNRSLAAKGKILFENNCADCHGTYGEKESYPNLLIPESIVKTDSLLFKSNYSFPQFINWFNNSWFTQSDHPAKLEPFPGYIAPPLDGIWITAPYFHNGSVPTLEAVLNSKLRPQFWSRDFDHPQYDYDKVGWKFTVHEKPEGKKVYNTNLPGYGNYGHYFGDALTSKERMAVIEYLKTL